MARALLNHIPKDSRAPILRAPVRQVGTQTRTILLLARLFIVTFFLPMGFACYHGAPVELEYDHLANTVRLSEPGPATLSSRQDASSMTLEMLVQHVLDHDPAVAAAREGVDAARAGVRAAHALPPPELRVSQSGTRATAPSVGEAEVDLRVKLPSLGGMDVERALARTELREAEATLKRQQWMLTMEVVRAYLDVASLIEAANAARLELSVQEQLSKAMLERVESGLATRVEASLEVLVYHEVADEVADLEGQGQLALTHLAAKCGVPVTAMALPDDSLLSTLCASVEPLPTEESVIRAALENRAGLHLEASALERADAALWQAKAEAWPWFSFVQVSVEPGFLRRVLKRTGLPWPPSRCLSLGPIAPKSTALERAAPGPPSSWRLPPATPYWKRVPEWRHCGRPSMPWSAPPAASEKPLKPLWRWPGRLWR